MYMMRIYHFIQVILLSITILVSFKCSSDENTQTIETDNDLIKISVPQFQTEGMLIGNATTQKFENLVKVNGFIVAPPEGMAQLSTYVPGTISNIYSSIGKYVSKGQILCSLSSKEIISLQQEFAETANRLDGLKADYQRSKSLIDEKIGSQKDFVAIESEYKSCLAKFEGLKSQLRLMNLDPKNVEEGNISSSFHIYAPINGYITMQNCILGKYAEPNQLLIEIVNISQLQLQLSVYEKVVTQLKIGQPVRFYINNKNNEMYAAELITVGKSINYELKTIQCIAKIKAEDCSNFVNQMYVDAEIITNQYNALAVPDDAILTEGKNQYVFIKDKQDKEFYYLRRQQIKTGAITNGLTEIIGTDCLENLIIKGVYNLPVE